MTRHELAVMALVALSFCSPRPGLAEPFRLFIANSYDPGYFWSAQQQSGIRDAFEGIEVEVREFFMDTKRNNDPAWLKEAAAKALAEIEEYSPDIVFTGDDNATKTIATALNGSETPVVFYGVNAEPEEYGLAKPGKRARPGGNVTGILERHFFVDATHLLETVVRSNKIKVEKLYLITDDSYTSKKLFEHLQKMEWDTPMEIVFLHPISTIEGFKKVIDKINRPGNACFVYNLQTIKGKGGEFIHHDELLEWVAPRLKIPSVSFHRDYIEKGLLLGILVSGYSQAKNAGVYGRRILVEDISPGELPIISPAKGEVALNSFALKQLGLKVPVSVLLGATVFSGRDE